MGKGLKSLALAVSAGLFVGLAGCGVMEGGFAPRASLPPQERPDPQPATPGTSKATPSANSVALRTYYRRVENDLLARGLMRTDGGGPDTPFTSAILARNFEAIALQDEYARGQGLRAASGRVGPVKKWAMPVRVAAEFGSSISSSQRLTDTAELTRFVGRLARVTGHPISMTSGQANFHVLFMGEDDKDTTLARFRALAPGLDAATLSLVRNLPRDIHCLVVAFANNNGGYAYGQAIALIRAEHPDLLRRSCIHEEVAQGLGLANDSPYARPSIFNDDDEFALLTTHDETLLRILYNPQLTPGMPAETAMPIVRQLAESLTGGPS